MMTDKRNIEENRMFEENLALVKHIIRKKYKTSQQDYDDVYQEGCLGLLHAVRNFNPEYGWQFSTYATASIVGNINRYYRDKHFDSMKAPRDLRVLYFKILKMTTEFDDDSLKKVAEKLDVDFEVVKEAALLVNVFQTKSLDYEYTDDGSKPVNFADYITDMKDDYEVIENNEQLNELMKVLTEKQRQVLTMYHIKGFNQVEIAKKLGITQVQASRILTKAKQILTLKAEGKEEPVDGRVKNLVEYQGKTLNLAEWSKITGINYSTLKLRLNKGWDLERVFAQ